MSVISNLLSNHHDGREVYQPVYEEFFTDEFCRKVKCILEIGLGSGTGLQGWLATFPNAAVYGMDIRTVEVPDHPRLVIREGDSAVKADVERFFKGIGNVRMDVIIDDADHQATSQLATLRNFLPHLSANGLYVIEDTGPLASEHEFVREVQAICTGRKVSTRPVSNLAGVVVVSPLL